MFKTLIPGGRRETYSSKQCVCVCVCYVRFTVTDTISNNDRYSILSISFLKATIIFEY